MERETVRDQVRRIAEEARAASGALAQTSADERNGALASMAAALRSHAAAIVEANGCDMDAARKAGASGGTILHGRGTGVHEAAQFFGVSIQPEKELVLILTRASERRAIMAAIAEGAHLDRQGQGLTFSLPVDEVAGIVHLLREDGAANEKADM